MAVDSNGKENAKQSNRDKHRTWSREDGRESSSRTRKHGERDRQREENARKRKKELNMQCQRSKDRHLDDDDDDLRDHHRKKPVTEKDNNNNNNIERKISNEKLERGKRSREEERGQRMDADSKKQRRVWEWQEFKRKNEVANQEQLAQASANVYQPGKEWSLEEESDDDNNDIKLDGSMKSTSEIDPLDAFMNSVVLPEVEKLNSVQEYGQSNGEQPPNCLSLSKGKKIPGEDSDSDYDDVFDSEVLLAGEDDILVKKTKAEKLLIIDHSKIEYPLFRKNFYTQVKEISMMSLKEVSDYRKQLELVIHGKDVPKPIKTWQQTGLVSKILDTIKKLNYVEPMAIQAQALPVIMSGRDCIGIAKTGSGKTLAFVLPMLRHIRDQPPVVHGDGPIALIMAPTRELVQQIHSEIKKFTKVMGVNCVPVYGGSGVAQQISKLRRGAEIVVCTPGRVIDMLCTNGGKIVNLCRVTYLVLDEADRMFDMGFEHQITRIILNIRPDRQTVLFSATFPHQVELLARKVLHRPVEIQVGGKSVVNKDITQLVEVRPESEKFLRFLEILGEWYEKGKILTFVHSQEKCDSLFKDLLRHGYPCLSFHGAKDQFDRESAISDFKSNVSNLLIATSVASRGLDVKDLELVVNYDVPNHYEDYVHRVGRTGRAGRKGYAITFISEEEARHAPELVKALELSKQAIPQDLKDLADGFMVKVKQGLEHAHGSGYGGSGFRFSEEEDQVRRAAKKLLAKETGLEEDISDSEDEDQEVGKVRSDIQLQAALAHLAGLSGASKKSIAIPGASLASFMNFQQNLAKIQAQATPEHYEVVLEINDIPQHARWKITRKETLNPISECTGVSLTTKGEYFPPGTKLKAGDIKLYLLIEGPNELAVDRAKSELQRALDGFME